MSDTIWPHKIHLIGNAHIDPAWLWRWTDGFSEVKATFRSALDRLEEFPGFVFTCAGACYYKWVEENCPEMFEEICKYVGEGRWVPASGWWVQPDCNIPCGESFARQSLYSQRYYLRKFGMICDTGYNVDSFGHSGMLPQILRKSGMDHYVFMRPDDKEKPDVPTVFRWESMDGSSVLTFKIPFGYGLSDPSGLEDKIRRTAELSEAQDTDMMLFYGVGNHGGGPTIALLKKIGALRQEAGGGALVFSSPTQFFSAIGGEEGKYPVVRDDLQHHSIGCYSAMLEIKQLNRRAETRLLAAERFDTLAHALFRSPAHTRALAAAWEKVMFNQFHDILCGCCVKPAYDDARESFGYSLCVAGEVLNGALQRISWSVDTMGEDAFPRSKEEDWKLWGLGKKGTPAVVFNPLPFDAKLPVEVIGALAAVTDAKGDSVPVQCVRGLMTNGANDKWNTLFVAGLPALGYATFWLHKEAAGPAPACASPVSVSEDGCGMANEFVEVLFDADTGRIADIYDKRASAHVLKGPGAAALIIDEEHSDTWGHGLTEYRDVVGSFGRIAFEVIERGPVRCRVRITGGYNASTLVQDFTLYCDRPEIEVRMKVHWREKHKLLKLEFPLNVPGGTSTAEIPYGYIERPMAGGEDPIQRWVDVGNGDYGVSVINDSSYSADVKDGTVRLTVLRSPVFADHYGERDSLCEYTEQGEREIGYVIYPHAGDWREAGTPRKAAALNMPTSVVYETYHKGPLPQALSGLRAEPGNISAEVFKLAEDGNGYILRCHETSGRETDVELELPLLGRKWRARFGRCEIKTFHIPFEESDGIKEVNLLEL